MLVSAMEIAVYKRDLDAVQSVLKLKNVIRTQTQTQWFMQIVMAFGCLWIAWRGSQQYHGIPGLAAGGSPAYLVSGITRGAVESRTWRTAILEKHDVCTKNNGDVPFGKFKAHKDLKWIEFLRHSCVVVVNSTVPGLMSTLEIDHMETALLPVRGAPPAMEAIWMTVEKTSTAILIHAHLSRCTSKQWKGYRVSTVNCTSKTVLDAHETEPHLKYDLKTYKSNNLCGVHYMAMGVVLSVLYLCAYIRRPERGAKGTLGGLGPVTRERRVAILQLKLLQEGMHAGSGSDSARRRLSWLFTSELTPPLRITELPVD